MNKRETLIKTIGDKLIDGLYELDDNYTYEADGEFGGREADCESSAYIEFGNGACDAECTVVWPYNKCASIEVILHGTEGIHEKRYKNIDNINDAVQEYIEKNLDVDVLLDAMLDDLRESSMDEYQRNGFASERDYLQWRYG